MRNFCYFARESKVSSIQILKKIHSNSGQKYINKVFETFLYNKRIKHTVNTPYMPKQNGVAECKNQIVPHLKPHD